MIDTVVKINNVEVTINGNPTCERNIKEEADTGKLVIHSTKSTRYEMYDKVDITTPYDTEEQYLIQADSIVQLNATMYEHTLTLFENFAYFNTIYPADRSFKVVGQTLEDILTVYQRELEAYHNVDITWEDIPQTVLDETIPYKEFAGLNFSAILLSLFRKIWAVPKVTRVGSTWDIYPLYHNLRNNAISKESISKLSQQNNVDYATKVKSQLKNAVNERVEGEVTWFPSASGYVKPRSSTLIVQASKLRYELDSNIVAILKAEAVGVAYQALNTDTSTTEYFNLDIDLTDRVVQSDIWDLLPTISNIATVTLSDNSRNYIQYKPGQPYITNLFEAATDKLIFSYDTEYLLNAIRREMYVNQSNYFTSNYSSIALLVTDTATVKMRFKYVRQRNIDLVHNRKTKGVMNDTTTIHTQRDASVELNEYKKNLKIYSNRMGNNENSKTKVFVYPDEPYELFDYTDDNTIVTRVQNTYHNTFVYCEYEESENFSNIEAEYALMRRSDPYTISSKSVTTNLVIQEYIEFSTTERDVNSRFTDKARRLLSGLFEATTLPYDKVAVGVFKPVLTSWNSDYAIHMPVEASGDGNLITIHVQFPHQTIAGKTYYDLDNDSYEDYLNPLPYTDVDGRLEDFELYFTPDIVFEDSGEYPLILDETDYLADAYTISGIEEPIDLDSAASFAVTLQASFIADDNIYIGNAMAKSNYLVKDQATTTAPKIYTSTKPYGQYDQAPRSYDTDNTANISYTYSYTNRTITITPSIAVDYFSIVKDDEILLAVNIPLVSGQTYIIYINYDNDSYQVIMVAESISSTSSVEIAYVQALNQRFDLSISSNGSVDITYVQALNQRYDLELSASGSINISYSTNGAYGLKITADSNVDIDYVTALNIREDLSLSATSSLDMTYTMAMNITVSCSESATSSLDMTYSGDGIPLDSPVEWVEITEEVPQGDGTCTDVYDLGNIEEVTIPASCVFNADSTYNSLTDVSTSIPPCSTGATYTLCLWTGSTWRCTDYVGAATPETTKWYECQLQ